MIRKVTIGMLTPQATYTQVRSYFYSTRSSTSMTSVTLSIVMIWMTFGTPGFNPGSLFVNEYLKVNLEAAPDLLVLNTIR